MGCWVQKTPSEGEEGEIGPFFSVSLNDIERIQFESYYRPMLNNVENWLFQISVVHKGDKQNAAYDAIRVVVRRNFDFPGVIEFMETCDPNVFKREIHDIIRAESKPS